MNETDDPYKILGVEENANENEIKKAYRKLALKHHPDKQKNDHDRKNAQDLFSKIANAYEILSDPNEREQHKLRKKYGGGPNVIYKTNNSNKPSSSSSPSPQQKQCTWSTPAPAPKTTRTMKTTSSTSPKKGYKTSSIPLKQQQQPKMTQFSNKNGKFTCTLQNNDGTTYTISGSGFSDPFELFKNTFNEESFENLFDRDRDRDQDKTNKNKKPKSKMKTKTNTIPKNTKLNNNNNNTPKTSSTTTLSSSPIKMTKNKSKRFSTCKIVPNTAPKSNTATDTKISKISPTRKNYNKIMTTLSPSPSPSSSSSLPRKSRTTSKIQPKMMKTKKIPSINENEKTIIPVSIKNKTKSIHHEDGSIETITETIKTMSDGTKQKSTSSKISNISVSNNNRNYESTKRKPIKTSNRNNDNDYCIHVR